MVIAERLDSLSGLDVAVSVRESHRNSTVPIMLVARMITPYIRQMVEAGVIDRCVDEAAETGAFLFEFNSMCGARAERAWDALDTDVARVLQTARHSYSKVFEATTADVPFDARLLNEVAQHLVSAIQGGRISAVMQALHRITSYNVCYTKLLRASARRDFSAAFRRRARRRRSRASRCRSCVRTARGTAR